MDGSATAEMPPAGAPPVSTEVGQHDGQVVDVYRAVAGEFALAPGHAALAEVAQHDGQVVDVHFAVAVGVAGEEAVFNTTAGMYMPISLA